MNSGCVASNVLAKDDAARSLGQVRALRDGDGNEDER